MAHIYMQFDFANEEIAQLARHKLEVWKQAFRLDKKLLYKFERAAEASSAEPATTAKSESAAKPKGKAKSNAKAESSKTAGKTNGQVQMLLRLGFSGHEKITEHRWTERIPTEEPFVSAKPVTVKPADPRFEDTEKRFENLE